MAKAKSEAGFDRELYDKLHKAFVKGNTTNVQSLLQKFTKAEAKDILNRHCSHQFCSVSHCSNKKQTQTPHPTSCRRL